MGLPQDLRADLGCRVVQHRTEPQDHGLVPVLTGFPEQLARPRASTPLLAVTTLAALSHEVDRRTGDGTLQASFDAGLSKIHYIDPYPKSRATDMYPEQDHRRCRAVTHARSSHAPQNRGILLLTGADGTRLIHDSVVIHL